MSLPFPKSLPDFQRLFPDDAACAKYLEAIRFPGGFECPACKDHREPGRIASRPHVLRCRACRAMAILTHPIAWRRPRPPNARPRDLDDDQLANVKRAVAFLRVRYGSAPKLAVALRMPLRTVERTTHRRPRISLRTALRVARLAGVPLDDVLGGAWPGERCAHCGRRD